MQKSRIKCSRFLGLFTLNKLAVGVLVLGLVWISGCAGTNSYDVIIEKGTIVDGTGRPGYKNDIGISEGAIAKIGDLSKARAETRIDASGMIVAPGFIDAHSHCDERLENPKIKANENFVRQGVTTCVFGVDGRATPESIRKKMAVFAKQGVGTNYAYYVGFNTVRQAVLGDENRAPTADELERMKALVKEGMEMGAVGLSSGLMYLPGRYATTEEVIALAEVVAPYDGIYDSHTRSPVMDFLGSVKECIDIGEQSGARPHPAHLKAVGKKNWGKVNAISDYIEAAIGRGLDVTCDQYPYDGAATAKLINVLVRPEGLAPKDLKQALRDPEQLETIRRLTESPPGNLQLGGNGGI